MFQELKPENEKEWLKLRRRVLTATDISVILGLNPWKSVSQMQEAKDNHIPLNNSYIWLGNALEPIVVKAVNEKLSREFKLFDDGNRSFFVDQRLGLGATPDAGDTVELLECKSTKPTNAIQWAYWPPAYYLMQLYVQMYCIGYESGILGVLSTNLTQSSEVLVLPLGLNRIRRSKFIDEAIVRELRRYWDCVANKKQYRVNRKQVVALELKLRSITEAII